MCSAEHGDIIGDITETFWTFFPTCGGGSHQSGGLSVAVFVFQPFGLCLFSCLRNQSTCRRRPVKHGRPSPSLTHDGHHSAQWRWWALEFPPFLRTYMFKVSVLCFIFLQINPVQWFSHGAGTSRFKDQPSWLHNSFTLLTDWDPKTSPIILIKSAEGNVACRLNPPGIDDSTNSWAETGQQVTKE